MSEQSIREVSQFFGRFRGVVSQEQRRSAKLFFSSFEELKAGLITIQMDIQEETRKTAPLFNVYTILGLDRFETRTHSAMLAHLLDPAASHGQQYTFLVSFLNYLNQKDPNFPYPEGEITSGHWDVRVELSTRFGRMDIVLRHTDLKYLLVIENKIDAEEQPEQLYRYGNWMKTQLERYPTQALIYLTIRGDKSTTARGIQYYPLSYRKDISQWLLDTIPSIQAPNVREDVKQYIKLAKTL